jgi:hypothetical protein
MVINTIYMQETRAMTRNQKAEMAARNIIGHPMRIRIDDTTVMSGTVVSCSIVSVSRAVFDIGLRAPNGRIHHENIRGMRIYDAPLPVA